MQDAAHRIGGGRLLEPDPNGNAGRDQQLQDTYVDARKVAPTFGLSVAADSNLFGDALEARGGAAFVVAPLTTGMSALSLRASVAADPLRHTASWLRPRAELAGEWTRYATNNPRLLAPGWFVERQWVFSPRLSLELVLAARRATFPQVRVGVDVFASPAGRNEPMVSSYASFGF